MNNQDACKNCSLANEEQGGTFCGLAIMPGGGVVPDKDVRQLASEVIAGEWCPFYDKDGKPLFKDGRHNSQDQPVQNT
ncbi:MAG: hypothetical protein HQL90_04145 [Magnetococcales bacterium]|nr:hypothetical protein [Magnetococcales bacterium]